MRRHGEEEATSRSAQIRQKLADLSKKRADHEKRIAEARSRQAKKDEEASSYRQRALRASASMTTSYLRQAASAEQAAIAEGKKVAEESKRSADCSSKEAALNKELISVLAQEAAAAKRERERQEATARREQERQALAARQRHEQEMRAERARMHSLVAESENRMTVEISRLRPPQVEQLRILYLTANSTGDLRVDEEMRRVKAGVRAATHRDLVQIEHKPAATGSDLLDGLTQLRPHVVHFSGHANEITLLFDAGSDRHGPGRPVDADVFARAMAAVDTPPTLVVLNACKSETQLRGLLAAVPLAIGMSDSIGDTDAMTFAARFYAAVAEGQSVKGAYNVAKVQMELSGLPDADLPTLASDVAVDPSSVILVIPPD